MHKIGVYEAKTKFNKILDRVAAGERIMITRHGVPVATLEPAKSPRTMPVKGVIDRIRELRVGRRLGRIRIKDLVSDGRR